MTVRVVYIDDEIARLGRDAQKVKELLEVPGEFECDLQPPPRPFSADITGFDAVLIDLDLSAPVDGEVAGYYGTTLASEARMRDRSRPIVLITRPNIIGGNAQLLRESLNLDLIVMKDQINRDPATVRDRIVSLVKGFAALHAARGQEWREVVGLTGADDSEARLLREAAPPFERGEWNVPQVANWIRNVVMGFPGILYDEVTVATMLGISLDSFRTANVPTFVERARYTGIFEVYGPRWWRGRLLRIAQSLMLEHGVDGPVSERFREAFLCKFDEELGPSICVVDGTPTADWVCHVLRLPVKQRNSIPYYPDRRPAVMDEARVSFKAIQESDDFDESLVDADGLEVVERLWE